MRIENNGQYFVQNTGLGTRSKIHSEKGASQIFPENTARESDEKTNDKLEFSPLSHFIRLNNNISYLGVEMNIQETGDGLTVENDNDIETNPDLEIIHAKREQMNDLLKKMGIKGQLTAVSDETTPQNYSTYYVETEGDAKNIFIIELENGEFIFTETEHDDRILTELFGKDRYSLIGIDEGKLSANELKKVFAKFFHVNQLKDFILEFPNSNIKK